MYIAAATSNGFLSEHTSCSLAVGPVPEPVLGDLRCVGSSEFSAVVVLIDRVAQPLPGAA